MIVLGSKVKDPITGLEGTAISRIVYLQGCARIGVQPRVDKEGKVPDSYYVDEPQLEVVSLPKVKTNPLATIATD